MRNFFSILLQSVRRRWILLRRIVFFIKEKQTENRVLGSNFLSMHHRPKSSRQRRSSLFQGRLRDLELARQRYCFWSQTERPAVKSPHDREARLFQSAERLVLSATMGERAHYLSVATSSGLVSLATYAQVALYDTP